MAATWALVSAQAAVAAEVTQVLSARSLKDFDFRISLDWLHEQAGGSIKRESVETTGVALTNDLVYRRVRDSLLFRGEVGLVHDLSFSLAGSVVLDDNRGLDFDRSGDCAASPCVESLLRDGILPGTQGTSWGIDAENGRSFRPPSNQVYSGPTRHGFEYLGLGLRWAALNQTRDPVKPTWTLGMEFRFSVAGDQRFDPSRPTANRNVGLGYHQFILSTMASHKFASVEPYLGAFFMQPMLTSDSVFKNVGTGSYASAQRRTGGRVGIEAIVWDNPKIPAHIALEASGRLEYRFAGLAQSELWEVLSGDSRCSPNTNFCRAGIDVDASGRSTPNPGVVRSPAYGLSGGDAGFSAHLGRHGRLRALFGMLFEEAHFFTDGGSQHSVYDIPGRRFKADGMYSWYFLLDVAGSF